MTFSDFHDVQLLVLRHNVSFVKQLAAFAVSFETQQLAALHRNELAIVPCAPQEETAQEFWTHRHIEPEIYRKPEHQSQS